MSWDSPSWKKAARDYHAEVEVEPARMKANGDDSQPAKKNAIKLTFFDECNDTAAKRWLIKGVIARGETSSWIAPPGRGKSALHSDISVHLAAGIDWRGHRTKGQFGVVYFAFERADLVKRRNAAYAKRLNLKGLPIAIAAQIINLMDPRCVDVILATIRAAEERSAFPSATS
jgi:RecA-family ATPase